MRAAEKAVFSKIRLAGMYVAVLRRERDKMKFSFNIDSKLWKFFDYAGDLVVLNLLFILTSIPVVTIGASITAMDSVLFKRREKRLDSVKDEYFKAFKENFKSSTIIWLIFLAFVFLCVLNFNLVSNTNPDNRKVILIVIGAILAVMFMTVLYSFAMLARFDNDWLTTVMKAFVIGILSFPYTVTIFLILTAGVLMSIQTYAAMLVASAVWILIGFSLVGFLCCAMFYRAFRRFTFREDLPEDTIDAEMYARRDYYREQKRKKKAGRGRA